MTAARPRAHSPELDGVRGIAIAGVMLMHFVSRIHGQSRLELAIMKISIYGGWGVDLFFVLSGFLITGILYDEKASTSYFRNFYARRTLRIFPLYYAVLLVMFVLVPERALAFIDPQLLVARQTQVWTWFYLTNVYLAREGSFAIPYVSHFWSLAVEEHFYLFWPLLVRFLPRAALMRTCVGLGLFSLALRVTLMSRGYNELTAFALTPCRLDALCWGGWFALATRGPLGELTVSRGTKLVLGTSLGVLLCSFWHRLVGSHDSVVLEVRGYLLAVVFGLSIFLVTRDEGPRRFKSFLRTPQLMKIGKYAYGLYVFHGIIAYGMHRHDTETLFANVFGSRVAGEIVEVLVGLTASMLIAVVSFEWFENPLLKLKRRFQ